MELSDLQIPNLKLNNNWWDKLSDLCYQLSIIKEQIRDKTNALTNDEVNELESLDYLSILKILWYDKIIKQIIEQCINQDSALVINEKWSQYYLNVNWFEYHIEIQDWLNTRNANIYSVNDHDYIDWLSEKLIMVLSCSEKQWSYYVLYKL